MGTLFRIVVYAESATHARTGFDAAFARARQLDARLSDYREDSELNQLCRARRAVASDDLLAVLTIALDIARTSHGAFDPTLGPFTSNDLPTSQPLHHLTYTICFRSLPQ